MVSENTRWWKFTEGNKKYKAEHQCSDLQTLHEYSLHYENGRFKIIMEK